MGVGWLSSEIYVKNPILQPGDWWSVKVLTLWGRILEVGWNNLPEYAVTFQSQKQVWSCAKYCCTRDFLFFSSDGSPWLEEKKFTSASHRNANRLKNQEVHRISRLWITWPYQWAVCAAFFVRCHQYCMTTSTLSNQWTYFNLPRKFEKFLSRC